MKKFKNWFQQNQRDFLNQLAGVYAGLALAGLQLHLNGMTAASNLVTAWGMPLGWVVILVPMVASWQKAKREEQLRLQHEAVQLRIATEQLKHSDLKWGSSR